MKNKKLKLSDLKVESFVTKLEKNEKKTVDGGLDTYEGPLCITQSILTAVGPTTLAIGAAEVTGTLTAIINETIKTQGPRLQSADAVACSRFICKTYNDIMKTVCC